MPLRRLSSSTDRDRLFNILALAFSGLAVLACLGIGLIFALDPFQPNQRSTPLTPTATPTLTPTVTPTPSATLLPILPPLPTEITATPLGATRDPNLAVPQTTATASPTVNALGATSTLAPITPTAQSTPDKYPAQATPTVAQPSPTATSQTYP